jgi:NADH-quinone oxidoreductase subunit N
VTGTFIAPHVAWAQLLPIILVLGAAVLGVLVEAFVPARLRRSVQLGLALAALAGSLVAAVALWSGVHRTGGTSVLGGAVLLDGPALVLQGAIAALTFLAVLVIADRTSTGEDAFSPQAAGVPGSDYEELARHQGLVQTEVYPLVLFSTAGMMIFPAAGDLLTLFVALEVLSLPLYLLTGLARRRRLLSQEASMKYFLLGAYASAFFLFGIALLYGFAGSVKLSVIAAAISTVTGMDTLLFAGVAMVLTGLLFKVGAVPFHSWTPDVYQGAPTPITGFMAACTKLAAFGALLRVMYVLLPGLMWELRPALWTVAILTMVVGTVIALVQTDVKRILAYSSIAHAGFLLTGVVSLDSRGISGVLFYLVAYGVATIGGFAVVTLVRERAVAPVGAMAGGAVGTVDAGAGSTGAVLGEATHVIQWTGLGRRHPWLAGAFAMFLLSFAGIPLTAGFVGKFAVFSAAVSGGAWPLAVVGVLVSAASVFFYVRIIVLMYFTDDADAAASGTTVVVAGRLTSVVVGVCAVATILLGVFPAPALELVQQAAKFLS